MSRRPSGEGSVWKRKDGKGWRGMKDLGWVDGKRKRKQLTGKTQAEVIKKLKELERQQEQGMVVKSNDRLTLGAFLERWLEATGPTVRPRSLVMYRLHVRNHIVPALGSQRLTALTPDAVQVFLNHKLDTLAPKTVMHLRATLRAALNMAVEWGYVPRNVVVRTKPPKAKLRELRVLDQDEAKRLLAAAEGDENAALYTVALAMGLRLGEALGLQWSEVDFVTGRVHVQAGLQRINGKLERTEPKTELSNRSIKMPEMVVASLREHQKRQRARGIVTPWVFCTERGTPIDPRNALRHFKSLLAKAGLPDSIRFHDLRHSCATLLLARGMNVKVISELLGHSNPTLLLTTYGHVLPQLRDQTAAEMDEVLGI
jgi:integrase